MLTYPLLGKAGLSGIQFHGKGDSGGDPNPQPGFDLSITRLRGGGITGPISKFYFHDLTFVNQKHHITAKLGTGSGRGLYERCTFVNCKIEFGTPGNDFNADQTTFRDCWFFESTIKNNTNQNVDYVFDNCTLVRCRPVFFYVDGGGKISFSNLTIIDSGIVCQVSGPGHVFGPENGHITFSGVDYEANHKTANGAIDILVNDVNTWYGKGRIMSANNVVFNRRFPGTLLKHTDKTEWIRNFGANLNLYTQPEPSGN